MQRVRLLTLLFMCFAVTQVLTAQTSSRKMRVKFSAPVEIPAPNTDASVMTLPAGTYIFKLLRSSSDRNIVQVLNEREDKVYSTILAVPDYRLNASSKTVMYFSERGAGAPSAIKSWFYPGDNSGSRFVYPKARAQAIAAAENVPIPSFSEAKPITAESTAVPVQVQTPAKQEVPYVAANLQQTDVADKAGTDGEPVQAATNLPKTASPIYAYAVAGLLLLGLAFVLRRINT